MSWRPTATLETLRLRGWMLSAIRDFFAERGVLEVETPQLSPGAVTDPQLQSLSVTDPTGMLPSAYLQTSPEFAMKRLLAAGAPDIFQIARVFRAGERGRRHLVEFTLLEWYRREFDEWALMEEAVALFAHLLAPYRSLQPPETVSFRDLLRDGAGIDATEASAAELRGALERCGIHLPAALDRGDLLDLLQTEVISRRTGDERLLLVHDYPAERAALAELNRGPPATAARFEVFLDGMELGNGFRELRDASEQARRFRRDLLQRRQRHLLEPPQDERLLEALAAGLPACAGIAVGVDRLMMCATHATDIRDVVSFGSEF